MANQSGEDEVDKLFTTYEAQAAADRTNTEIKLVKESQKRQKSMQEVREEGLAAPIAKDNKGFQMLAAMGYQQGQGLGRGQSGRVVPVAVQLKGGRHGLGVEENKKRKQLQVKQQQRERDEKRARMQQDMQAEHKVAAAVRAASRRAEAQLLQARQVCETLDRRQGIEASEMWPVPPAVPDAGAPAGSDPDTADAQQDGNAQQSADTWEDQPVHAKLAAVLDHLRQTYHYCLYCGCQYGDAEDLAASCPGLQEDEH